MSAMVHVFVYGTLQRGQRFHLPYCASALRVIEARVVGRLYHLPAGYPAIEVPERGRLAAGTDSLALDAWAMQQLRRRMRPAPLGRLPAGDWDWVEGEIMVLPHSRRVLTALDALEDYRPRSPATSLYQRVAVWARTRHGPMPVWIYHMPRVRGGRRIGSRWPQR